MTAPISPAVRQAWTMNTPMRAAGRPADVALAALYLACDDSAFVTGQIMSPSGGWWMP